MNKFLDSNENLKIIEGLILDNQNLLKLIAYDDGSPLSHDVIEDPYSLINDRIFNTQRIPKADEEAKTILTYHIFNFRKSQDLYCFVTNKIVFDVMLHQDVTNVVEKNDSRLLLILNEIDKMVDCSRFLKAVGQSRMIECTEMLFNDKFNGYRYVIELTNFNGNKK